MRSIVCALLVLAACLPSHEPSDGKPPAPVTAEEHQATILALAPPKHPRPLIAIVTSQSGTETTDLLIPYGVLHRADVADVFIAGSTTAELALMPALRVIPQKTFDALDTLAPDGMDYVVVPAQMDVGDAAVVAWVKAQAAKGALIVGICSGVQTVGRAGLLDGRKATGHWADLVDLTARYPTMTWVRDRRYVVDRGVATTTGVSASLPASVALVEAIAGTDAARALADELGLSTWSEEHDSDAFSMPDSTVWTVAGNELPAWDKQRVGLSVEDGVDEVSLALMADAFSRTYRSRAETVGQGKTVTSLGGLVIAVGSGSKGSDDFSPPDGLAGTRLDVALTEIERRYGKATARFVAVQEEYPWP